MYEVLQREALMACGGFALTRNDDVRDLGQWSLSLALLMEYSAPDSRLYLDDDCSSFFAAAVQVIWDLASPQWRTIVASSVPQNSTVSRGLSSAVIRGGDEGRSGLPRMIRSQT